MIDLGSIAGLHSHAYELHCYCSACDRWSVLDLEQMVRDGHGERRLPIRVRCHVCGESGQPQVRAPMPTRTNANGWIAQQQEARREAGLTARQKDRLRCESSPRQAETNPPTHQRWPSRMSKLLPCHPPTGIWPGSGNPSPSASWKGR